MACWTQLRVDFLALSPLESKGAQHQLCHSLTSGAARATAKLDPLRRPKFPATRCVQIVIANSKVGAFGWLAGRSCESSFWPPPR